MTFMSENTARRIDKLGRISIPKSLRDRFNITENDELEFSVCQDGDLTYICMNKKNDNLIAERAAMDLESLGIEIPEALLDMLG